MIDRILSQSLANWPKSLLLLGPRQVGKSTLCRALAPELSINLSNQKTFTAHLKDPGLLERLVVNQAKSVFIDEVQRIPSILNTVQALIDEHKIIFYLTGSSARKLKRGQANLLPGRVLYAQLPPLVYAELKAANRFDLVRAITYGTLPEVYLNDYGPQLLDSYVQTYLREEIQAEALTKDLGAYGRFLDLSAELSGQYINYAKIASDSEINKETIRRYFAILHDTLFTEYIPSYTEVEKRRKARQRDRYIFFDLGVRNALLGRFKFSPEEFGSLLEQWLVLQVLYANRLFSRGWKIYCYRDDGGIEVDLLIDNGEVLFLIEIKSSKKASEKYFHNLTKFAALTGRKTKAYCVYLGESRQTFAGLGEALPVELFLDLFCLASSAAS